MMNDNLDPQNARQGEKGSPVLKVLIAGLVLAIIVWGGVSIFGEASDPEQPVGENAAEDDAGGAAQDDAAPTVD